MTTKADFILNEALLMSPGDRARIAHCLISSLDQPESESVDAAWIKLARNRVAELENGSVQPVYWEDIKNKAGV